MLLLLLKLELLEIPPNYVTLDSRITQLEHYLTLQITSLINLVLTQIFIKNLK